MNIAGSDIVESSSGLLAEVDDRRREIRADGYAMSIGELASLYEENEMEIQPKFQRFFRWSVEQKTNLVESILLGIPLPQIFVSQREDGVWEVVDGLQRLSSIFQFMGKLRDINGGFGEKLVLTEPKYLPSLKGMSWDDLPQPLRLDFRRSKVNVSIIMRGGDVRAKYDLFERLNTGGSRLSEQEVRNCILIMENERFYLWLEELSKIESYQKCVGISERLQSEGYYMELASRLLVFHNNEMISIRGDIGAYLTGKLIDMSKLDASKLSTLRTVFEETFQLLDVPDLGENAFRRFDTTENRFKGPFIITPFEVIGCGIAYHLATGASVAHFPQSDLVRKIKKVWSEDETSLTKHGRQNPSYRLRHTIPLGRQIFHT